MSAARLMLVDGDDYTASVLLEELARLGHGDARRVASILDLPEALKEAVPDVVVFNVHTEQPQSLAACSTIKLLAPKAAILAVVATGPMLKAVREWSGRTRTIDEIVSKPLSGERFSIALGELLRRMLSSRDLETRAERLSNLVPEGALSAIGSESNGEAELFEAAVLFTDIRGSSELIRKASPRDFFLKLNALLSAHTRTIRSFEGSVVKYTGDGAMAIFRGMGRSYVALKCAMELARESGAAELPYGVGLAEGLVLAGFIGDSNLAGHRRQYDVIGATVHLAARLCGLAEAGEVVATRSINAVARLDVQESRVMGGISIKGFDNGVECAAFRPSSR
jgi:adenylate cyclase